MKQFILTLLLVAVAFASGVFLNGHFPPEQSVAEQRQVVYWVAPMDPNYRRDQPGQSPMGMDLIPVYAEGSSDTAAGLVKISAAVENNLGVKTAAVEQSVLSNDINTVGYVNFDEDRLHHIHMRVDGWIEKLNVSAVGEKVTAGQVLFELYSPTLFNAQKDLVLALRNGDKQLIRSARQRMRLLGMNAAQIEQVVKARKANERIGILATHSGIVSDLNVRHGMYIEPATEVMAIGSIETVWIIAEVFERQSAWLQQGQLVTMTADSYPGEQWQAQVDYIYPILDPQARTVQVRVRVDNPALRLKPNMFANLVIHTRGEAAVLNIPGSALIRGGRNQRVVKALGDGRFRSVPVRVGRETGDRVEVLAGLVAGEQVVISAQFLLDSESNIDAESERMDGMLEAGDGQ